MIQFKLDEYAYPKKLPWIEIFKDLEKHGVTPSMAGELIGAGWSTLQKWRSGTEPKHSIGISILTLHTRYCGEDLTNQRITEAE